jgi:hypothetical protein
VGEREKDEGRKEVRKEGDGEKEGEGKRERQ